MNILITGGASGLGEAITRTLAKDAANTIYFTFSRSDANAKIIEAALSNTKAVKCDFSNESEVKSLVESIPSLDLDALVNNAYSGDFLKTYFHKIKSEDFAHDFKVNVIPTIEVTQAVINSFRKKKSGRIITVLTSALMNVPPIGSAVYVANKAYIEKLTKVWASENAKFNITSNSVSPSFMQTSMTANTDERMIEQMKESHPLKRILTVEEVAQTILYLTKASAHINGVDIVINAASNIN